MNKKIIEDKKFDFGQWKTWCASRSIDLDRRIHILKEAKEYVENKEELWRTLVSLCSQKLFLESVVRRASNNDTVDIIKWESNQGNGD